MFSPILKIPDEEKPLTATLIRGNVQRSDDIKNKPSKIIRASDGERREKCERYRTV